MMKNLSKCRTFQQSPPIKELKLEGQSLAGNRAGQQHCQRPAIRSNPKYEEPIPPHLVGTQERFKGACGKDLADPDRGRKALAPHIHH
jgi:hypothetical protein